jgi:Mn2+/Fe2+ NRAMP family transporter
MSQSNTDPALLTYPVPPDHVRRRTIGSALKLFGPGAIIASVTIGSGETLFASRTGAIFGYGLLWFIVLCAACKLTQVYAAGRYMVLTGEHPMEAWARLPGPRGWFPAFLGLLSVFCFPFWLGGLAKMVGTTINWIFGLDQMTLPPDELHRTLNLYAQLIGTGILLLAGVLTVIQTYRIFEKVQTGIVAVLLIAILVAMGVAPIDWIAALRHTLIVRMPEYTDWMRAEHADVVQEETVLLAMVVFMGAIGGGTYDYIGYLSFFREKRWAALGIGRESSQPADHAPPQIQLEDTNITAGRQWLRAPMIDVFTGFLCVLIFTIAFNLLGAAILHTARLVPKDFDLLTHQVRFLTQFGEGFKYLYQVGILMAFWGTIYGAMEVYSRTAYECARPLFAKVRTVPYERFRLPVCLYAGIGGVLLMWFVEKPLDIVKPAALIGTTTCGIWCFAMIWADRKVLPKQLRMNGIWLVGNLLAGTTMTAFGLKAIWDYVTQTIPRLLEGS